MGDFTHCRDLRAATTRVGILWTGKLIFIRFTHCEIQSSIKGDPAPLRCQGILYSDLWKI